MVNNKEKKTEQYKRDHTVFVGEVVAITGNPMKSKHLYAAPNSRLIALDLNGNIIKNIEKDR